MTAEPSVWTASTWGDIAALRYGRGLTDYRSPIQGVPVYGTNGQVGRTTSAPLCPHAGVVVGRKGAYRGIHYSADPFFVIDTAYWLQPLGQMDLRWAYYQLLTQDINGMDSGSAIPSTSRSDFYALAVPVPPITEQRGIAATLGALDDKIESNRRQIVIVHEFAAALCQSILGNSTEVWADSWPSRRLDDVLSTLEVGRRPAGGIKHEPDGIPSIGAESIVQAGSFDFGKTKRVSKEFFASMRRGRLEHLDVLLYKDGGTPGNFIPHVSATGHGFPFSVASINEHVYRLRISPPYSQSFLYFWLSSPRLLAEMRRRGTGAAIPGLNSSAVRDLPVLQPPPHLLSKLQDALDPLLDLILRSAKESRACAQLRDALLPELLSGRLRVPEAATI